MEVTPHVVLEAIANKLPEVCNDTCGHDDSVIDRVGTKIQINQSVKDFSHSFDCFYCNSDDLKKCLENCKKKTEELSWANNLDKMIELYKGINVNGSRNR